MRLGVIATLFSLAAYPAAGEIRLSLPVECTPGQDCYIQHFVDRDPGPDVQDFTCGSLSYDGHKGTDIALPHLRAMQAGVNVLAAADGVVAGVRDGMPDKIYAPDDAEALQGRDCGNGVLLRHPDGWETQYCHLRQGSVQVVKGDRVTKGHVLGQIGLSGRTQFPHLHLSVRHKGKIVDPFQPNTASCGGPDDALWDTPPMFAPGGLVYAGFTDGAIPEFTAVKEGTASRETLAATTPALTMFALAYGGQIGDEITLRIEGPNGEILENHSVTDRSQILFFRAAGKRLRAQSWPKGTYSGHAQLHRNGELIGQTMTEVEIR
jgi:hypothetical protein